MNKLYKDRASRVDTVVGTDAYYQMLMAMYDDFLKENSVDYSAERFELYMENHWGIKLEKNESGITNQYTVVDSDKFLLAQIKYGILG